MIFLSLYKTIRMVSTNRHTVPATLSKASEKNKKTAFVFETMHSSRQQKYNDRIKQAREVDRSAKTLKVSEAGIRERDSLRK